MKRRRPSSPSERPAPTAGTWLAAAAAAATAVGACVHAPPAPTKTSASLEEGPRRAPGVVTTPAAARPSAVPRGETSSGIVTLRTPPDDTFTRELVARFFAAVVAEDSAALGALLGTEAWVGDLEKDTRSPALPVWQARMARLEYGALADRVVYRPGDVSVFRGESAVALGARRAGVPGAVPLDAVLVRVPIATPRVGTATLFGAEMWFVLMPGPNGYRIAWLLERTRVP